MLRRRSSLAVSKESPKDAFIAILRSLSERSDPYFYGLNAFKDDGFGIHRLLDLQWQQMRKIFKMFLYTGKKGDVSHGDAVDPCSRTPHIGYDRSTYLYLLNDGHTLCV